MNGWLLSAHIIEPIYPTHPHVGNSILMPKFLVRTFDHENGMFESMVCISILQLFGQFRWIISKIQLLQKDKLHILVEHSKNLSIKLIIFSSEVFKLYILQPLELPRKKRTWPIKVYCMIQHNTCKGGHKWKSSSKTLHIVTLCTTEWSTACWLCWVRHPATLLEQARRCTQHNGQGQDHSRTLRSGGGRFINYTEPLNSGMCRKPEQWRSNTH